MSLAPDPRWDETRSIPERAPFTWNRVLWSLVFPQRRQRVMPTVSGVLLVLISFGIGTAAYNAGNNILFITLSLLLACLIASGVLSWLNFRGLDWRLELQPPMRVGRSAAVNLRVYNGKSFLPTYGLWFELGARAVDAGPPGRAETTFTARGAEIRAALMRAARAEAVGRVPLRARLDPKAASTLEWSFTPDQRGRWQIELRSVGSLFPFGFLRKEFTTTLSQSVIVWPEAADYRAVAVTAARQTAGSERVPRTGSGEDLFALRRYQSGDSHRLIHWKASARTRQLLVRQYSAQAAEGFALWLRSDGFRATGAEQHELLVRFAAALAEDLFRAGQLTNLVLNDAPPQPVRRLQDLEAWLDAVAVVPGFGTASVPSLASARPATGPHGRSLITFVPDGPRGVAAMVDGELLATA